MRYIVFGIILFLPLIIYFTWAYIVTRKKEESDGQWNEGPITRLFVIGLVLMAGALVVSRFMNPGEKPTRLVPPQYEDDRFIRQREREGDLAPRRESAEGPSASPAEAGERLLAEDRDFLERAQTLLNDFLRSDNIELIDTLVTKSDRWGPVLRADFQRRVEGRSQPVERIVIWEGRNGIHMELPDPVGLAPLNTFTSEMNYPLDGLPDFDADDPAAMPD